MVNRRVRKRLITVFILVCLGGAFSTSLTYWTAGPRNTVPSITYQGIEVKPLEADASTPTLRLLSLNLAHGRKDYFNQMLLSKSSIENNLKDVVEAIHHSNVQVAAFQEADASSFWSGSFNHVRYISRNSALGYATQGEHVSAPHLSYGTALISAFPMESAESHTFSPRPPSLTKGYAEAMVDWPGDPNRQVTVVSVHFDFLSGRVRARQVKELLTGLRSHSTPLVVMGDFNSDWRSDGSAVKQLASALNLKVYDPDSNDLATLPRTGRRVDWILISPDLVFRSYEVLHDVLSDHLGVVAEIAFAGSCDTPLETGPGNGKS